MKSHSSGTHFDDNFITLEMVSCIMIPDPIFRMAEIILAIIMRC